MRKSKQKSRRYKRYIKRQKNKPLPYKEVSFKNIEIFLYNSSSKELIQIQNMIMHIRWKKALENGVDIGYKPLITHY